MRPSRAIQRALFRRKLRRAHVVRRRPVYVSHGASGEWFIVEPRDAPGQQIRRLREAGRTVVKIDQRQWTSGWRPGRSTAIAAFIAGIWWARLLGWSKGTQYPGWANVLIYVALGAVSVFALYALWQTRGLIKALKEEEKRHIEREKDL